MTTTVNPARQLDAAQVGVEIPPDSLGYRVKRRLLGQPLHSEALHHERLGKPTALAVFASDNLSSSAYATEEILRVLVPAVGLAAFSLVVPITIAMLVVLAFLILSYRETIKAYPTAGGAYVVTRDNFGRRPALVAGVSLLTDYVLTVSVSVAAGTAALASAIDALAPYRVEMAVGFIALIALGNLRGVRESGKLFATPTYFFMLNMVVLLGVGMFRLIAGDLPTAEVHEGALHFGDAGDGLLMGATLWVVLHAFASGGAAVTGVEAISNGVPAFRQPDWKNARTTLVIMGACLGAMFLGLSILAGHMHVPPYEEGTPTVISQVGELIYGGGLGHVLYLSLQVGTTLILVLAANTSFADFPRLASFQANDNFLPRQLTKRGHRLVFSNGILALSAAATVLTIATGARVEKLIALYAIGVFTSFTMSQTGMAKHHLTHREPHWRRGFVINGVGAFLSLGVDIIIAVTKFSDGAWVVLVLVPVVVVMLMRLARQYEHESDQLVHGVPEAATARILRRHVVMVFVDRLDLATARAIQYARTMTPDELRAVHFVLDAAVADELAASWRRLGLARIPLELVACPDRRLTRAAVETVAFDLADGETEVSVLLPDRKYPGLWHRILHDQTAESLIRAVSRLSHANVTTVPFHFDEEPRQLVEPLEVAVAANGHAVRPGPNGNAAADDPRWRQRVVVEGTVRSMRVQPLADAPSLECVLTDGSTAISIVFFGRREIAGIAVGTRMRVEGTVGDHKGRLAIINPLYQLLA